MAEKTQTVTIMLNPRAKKATLALRIGAIPPLRAGRRRELPVSELAKHADAFIDLAKSGALRAYDSGLTPMSADEFVALLGGEATKAPEKPEEKAAEPSDEKATTPPPPPPEDEETSESSEPTKQEEPETKKAPTKKRTTKKRSSK